MPEAWLANWEERVRAIAANLLTLEVNTVVKNGMVAQKMPEVPVALHALVHDYAGYTEANGAPVTHDLLHAAVERLADVDGRSAEFLGRLSDWAHEGTPLRDHAAADAPAVPVVALTNGAESFEALVWAATAARHAITRNERGRNDVSPGERLENQGRAAILTRIEDNSRQLREVAIVLEQAFSSFQPADALQEADKQQRLAGLQQNTQPYAERLRAMLAEPPAPAPETRLFGGTVDQTTKALFRHPRPALSVDPDLTVLVRKAWDIALEEVRFQTVVQVDGDVLVRVADMPTAQRDFLASLHRNAVEDGTKQWSLLFQVMGNLLGSVGALIFGARPPAA